MVNLSGFANAIVSGLPTFQGINETSTLAQQFASSFLDRNGDLDSAALGKALGLLARSDLQLAHAIRQELNPQIFSLKPIAQLQFEHQFNAGGSVVPVGHVVKIGVASVTSAQARAPSVINGQVTFNAEGNDNPRSPFFSRALHWPGGASGVTIGRGYDLGSCSPKQVMVDLTSSGVPASQARQIAASAGLHGKPAQNFVTKNKAVIGQISQAQEINLFNRIYPQYEVAAQLSYEAKVLADKAIHKNTVWPSWNQLDSKVKTVVVDLVYQQGSLWDRQMPAIRANDREVLAKYIERTPELNQYEGGRARAGFLRA